MTSYRNEPMNRSNRVLGSKKKLNNIFLELFKDQWLMVTM